MDEDYIFNIRDEYNDDKVFVLIIYDIESNTKRVKLSKFLQGYGFRIQKSAFEALITKKKYEELISKIGLFASKDDSIRVYKIIGKGQVTSFGKDDSKEIEEVLII